MKKIHGLLWLLSAAAMCLLMSACTDTVDYVAEAGAPGSEVYFALDQSTVKTLSNTRGTFKLSVYRADKSMPAEYAVHSVLGESAEGHFTVPSTVEFKAGKDEAELKVKYADLVQGETYKINLSLGDNPYAVSELALSVTFPEEVVYEWEVVSDSASYIENMSGPWGYTNALVSGMTVEKAKGHNIYRFESPYDNDYMETVWGVRIFKNTPADFKPYIVLDGETYADDGWYIAPTKLGFKTYQQSVPTEDYEYELFGSVAGNLRNGSTPIEPGDPDFPLGTFNSRTKMFDFGVVYQSIDGYGIFPYQTGTFLLYLDPSLLSQDYDRDYTWEDRPELTSLYTSSLMTEGWEQAIQQAKEDKTLYRFPSLYQDGANIVFYCDTEGGTVTIPQGQKTGLTTNFGNAVYLEGTPGKSSYDSESEVLTLGYTFYLADEKGNKTAELIQSTETVLWGHATEIDQLVPGSELSDFVGDWNAYGINIATNKSDTATVTIKLDNVPNQLTLKGMSNIDWQDTYRATYDKRTGFIKVVPQKMTQLDAGSVTYSPTLSFINMTAGTFSTSEKESLTGGFTKSGKLKFVNTATNEGRYDAMAYLAKQGSGYVVIGDQNGARYTYLTWERATKETAVAQYMPTLKKTSVYESPFKLKEAGRVRERVNPFLNMVPRPVEKKAGVIGGSRMVMESAFPLKLEKLDLE